MKELGPISKKLQNKMKFILDDMKQGCKLTRRQFGRKIESRDTFRIDSKFFSNTKLPQDLPDMAIMVLIDESGSMSGSRIEAARKAAYLLYDFASGLNIPLTVPEDARCSTDKVPVKDAGPFFLLFLPADCDTHSQTGSSAFPASPFPSPVT